MYTAITVLGSIVVYVLIGLYIGAWNAADIKKRRRADDRDLTEDDKFGVFFSFAIWPLVGIYLLGVVMYRKMSAEPEKSVLCRDCETPNLPDATYCKLCGHLVR